MTLAASTRSIAASAGAHLPDLTDVQLSPERIALWNVERELWLPRTITVVDKEQGTVAAALTAGRPHTAYRKVVDIVALDDDAWHRALDAAVADATAVNDNNAAGRDDPTVGSQKVRPAPLVVKFEEHPSVAPLNEAAQQSLDALGFSRDADALPSVASTRTGDATYARSWSKWLGKRPKRRVPYYGQTTDVTCGAVTSLMAMESVGLGRFGADGTENQAHEIDLWRRATNLPACEPIGLAVTTALEIESSALPYAAPRVILSSDDLVLLEEYQDQPHELRLRTQLQLDSLRQAESLGLPIERRWIEVSEIRDFVANGAVVFLLIALEPLIGDPAPHWVLAHEVIDDTLIIADPWVESEHGETWVDTHELPIPLAGIDLITRWGDPVYRGVVVLPSGGSVG